LIIDSNIHISNFYSLFSILYSAVSCLIKVLSSWDISTTLEMTMVYIYCHYIVIPSTQARHFYQACRSIQPHCLSFQSFPFVISTAVEKSYTLLIWDITIFTYLATRTILRSTSE